MGWSPRAGSEQQGWLSSVLLPGGCCTSPLLALVLLGALNGLAFPAICAHVLPGAKAREAEEDQ